VGRRRWEDGQRGGGRRPVRVVEGRKYSRRDTVSSGQTIRFREESCIAHRWGPQRGQRPANPHRRGKTGGREVVGRKVQWCREKEERKRGLPHWVLTYGCRTFPIQSVEKSQAFP